jgi:hypothetical protein
MSGKKAKPITKVVVISDLHIWSTVGLWPEGFVSCEQVPIGQNPFQKILWDCWMRLWHEDVPKLTGGDPFLLLINGDIVEGSHHKAVQLMSANEDDQFLAVKEVFKPCGHARAVIVEGTECHTRTLEHAVASQMDAIPCPNTRRPAHPKLWIDIEGFRLIARHHMPGSSALGGDARALKSEFDKEVIAAASVKEPRPDILCMAHRHNPGAYRWPYGISIVTPPWQGLTRFGWKAVPAAHATTPGACFIDFEDIKRDGLPHAEMITFRPAPTKATYIRL